MERLTGSLARRSTPEHPAGRAAVVTAPGAARLEQVPVPAPGPGQVLFRVEGCGVCGSNLPVWEGREWFRYPLEPGAPGHEAWGVVEETGPGVTHVRAGDRIAALSYRGFASFDVADAAAVVRLPDGLADLAFPGEPLGCAMNVFRRSGIERGTSVAIIGIGFLGALLTQLAVGAGARVIAISRRAFALDVARRAGAHEQIPLEDHHSIIEQVGELTGGTFCDVTVECTGLQWPLDLAAELTRERGRLVVAGFHQDGPRQVNMFLWNWRGLDVINAHERDPAVYVRGIRDAVVAVAAGMLDPGLLLTHTWPLAELPAALDAARERPDGFMKALVIP